jgi:hypothetical protein
MYYIFNKFTSKQVSVFVLFFIVLFSMLFLGFREGLEGITIKPQISPGRCDAATTCDTCGQIAYDSSGSACYWCGVDKGCKSSSEYYDMATCAKGCRVPPNPAPGQQKKYPSTGLTPDKSGNLLPVGKPDPSPYNPNDITKCLSPCAINTKGYCTLGDKPCPPVQTTSPAVTSLPVPVPNPGSAEIPLVGNKETSAVLPGLNSDNKSSEQNKIPKPVLLTTPCQNISMFNGKIYLNPSDLSSDLTN